MFFFSPPASSPVEEKPKMEARWKKTVNIWHNPPPPIRTHLRPPTSPQNHNTPSKIYRFRHILWNNTASGYCTVDIWWLIWYKSWASTKHMDAVSVSERRPGNSPHSRFLPLHLGSAPDCETVKDLSGRHGEERTLWVSARRNRKWKCERTTMTRIEKLLALINGMMKGKEKRGSGAGGVSQTEQITVGTRQLFIFSHHLFTVL